MANDNGGGVDVGYEIARRDIGSYISQLANALSRRNVDVNRAGRLLAIIQDYLDKLGVFDDGNNELTIKYNALAEIFGLIKGGNGQLDGNQQAFLNSLANPEVEPGRVNPDIKPMRRTFAIDGRPVVIGPVGHGDSDQKALRPDDVPLPLYTFNDIPNLTVGRLEEQGHIAKSAKQPMESMSRLSLLNTGGSGGGISDEDAKALEQAVDQLPSDKLNKLEEEVNSGTPGQMTKQVAKRAGFDVSNRARWIPFARALLPILDKIGKKAAKGRHSTMGVIYEGLDGVSNGFGEVRDKVRGAFKTDYYDQFKRSLDKLKEAREEAKEQAKVAATALASAKRINTDDGADKAKALNTQRAIAERAAEKAEEAAKKASDALVKVNDAIRNGGPFLHGDINGAVTMAKEAAENAKAARESADAINGMVGRLNGANDDAVEGAKKAESQAARAQSAELYRDRVATMMQRDAFVVASKTKNLTGALCLMNVLVLCAIFGFVTIAFAVNLRSDEYFPVLSSDVFVISGLSATFVVLRHIVREFWIGLTFLAVVTSIFSFFANLNAFQVIQNATALDAMTGTIHVNPHLNRTVVNPAAAEFPMSWWDGTKAMHVIIMGTETASAVFLLLIGMYNLYCASSISDDAGYAGSDDDEAKLQADTFQDILDESADQFGEGVGEAVSACTSFQCWDLTRCCPRRTMKSIGDSKYLLIAYMWACLLAGLMLFVYVIFALSAAVDRIPMWTAMYSPHFMLAIGIAVSIVPPVGETWWTVGADYYNRRVKAGRDVKLTLSKPQWGKRFFCGWVFLIVGVAISSAALVFQTQHVEYTTGAKWLDQLSYQQALNCTTATPELKGGYVYTCSDDQTVRRKLVEYGYGYHVIELMMLIFGGMTLVSGTMLFIVDTMNRTKVHKNLIRGPRPKKGEYLPLMIRSLEGLALLSTMDQSYQLFFEELSKALDNGDPAYWRALTPLDRRWAMNKYKKGYGIFEAQNAPSDDWTRASGFSGGGYGSISTLRNRNGMGGAGSWTVSDDESLEDWDDLSDSEASTDGETMSHGSRRSRGSQRSRVSRRSSQSQSRRADHSPERRPRDLNINVSAKAGMEQPMAYPMQQPPPPMMMYPMQQQPPPMYTVQQQPPPMYTVQPPPMPMTPRSRQNLYAYPSQDFGYDYDYGY